MKTGKQLKLPIQQLLILSICRFAEPIALTSVFPYLPEMIESFDVDKKDIAKWAGLTSAVFSFSQCLTGIPWGRASDRFGRKPVILIGLTCTMSACLLFGFSRSLSWAIIARSFAGASSGTVGIIRTTVAEMVPEKSLQPRAFSVMPLVWSIGAIIGPILGGALANPAKSLPQIFGGIAFFHEFPFALPNMFAACLFMVGVLTGFLFLKETLSTRKDDRDVGRILGGALVKCFSSRPRKYRKGQGGPEESAPLLQDAGKVRHKPEDPPAFKEVFTHQSNLNLLAYTLLALHSVAYDQLIPVFLYMPLQDSHSSYPERKLPFKFDGGMSLEANRIGLIFTLYGVAAMILQFGVFPPIARNYGVLNSLKVVTLFYPLAYFLTPFTVLMPTSFLRQLAILLVMMIKCLAGVFAFPCTTILLTNSARSLRLLGTLNGVATSISAIGRACGPEIAGSAFSYGVGVGYVILPWWLLAAFALLGHIPCHWLEEMDGFSSEKDEDDKDNKIAANGPEGSAKPGQQSPTENHASPAPFSPVGSDTEGASRKKSIAIAPIHEEREQEAAHAVPREVPAPMPVPGSGKGPTRAATRRSNRSSRSSSGSNASLSTSPIGIPKGIGPRGKGRQLSNNLALSEGLGRTAVGGGFGTRGPNIS